MKIYHWILSPSFWHICYPTFRLIEIIEGSTNMLVNLWLKIICNKFSGFHLHHFWVCCSIKSKYLYNSRDILNNENISLDIISIISRHICYPPFILIQIIEGSTNAKFILKIFVTNSVISSPSFLSMLQH